MEQPPNPPPRRGTQPLSRPGTSRDAFVVPAGRMTQPLPPRSPEALQQVVLQQIEAIRQALAFVQRLTQLFCEPILVLRYALYLETVAEPVKSPPEAFHSLEKDRQALACGIADRLCADRELMKRLQVAVVQYDEAAKGYQEMVPLFAELEASPPADAWVRLADFAIERLKGKAYPITGFYGSFKNDPLLSQVFPAPKTPPQVPGDAPMPPPGPENPPSGLLERIKGLWTRS